MDRIIWYDKLKGVAIFLVIWGHILLNCIIDNSKSFIVGIVYSVHIPLFLVISGFLIKEKPIKTTLTVILKRFISPYIVWCIILSCFYLGYKKLTDISLFTSNFLYIGESLLHNFLWFLKVYSISLLLYNVLKNNKFYKFVVGTTILIVMNFLLLDYKYFSELFSLTLYVYVFLSISSVLRNFIGGITIKQGGLFFLLFVLLLPFATMDNNYFSLSFASLYEKEVWYLFVIRLLIGLSMSLFLISLRGVEVLNKPSILSEIGKHTIYIYLLQSLLVEAVLPRLFSSSYISLSFVVAIIMTLISYYLVVFIKRFRIINKILFGSY